MGSICKHAFFRIFCDSENENTLLNCRESAFLLVPSAFKFPRRSEGKAKKPNAFMVLTKM